MRDENESMVSTAYEAYGPGDVSMLLGAGSP